MIPSGCLRLRIPGIYDVIHQVCSVEAAKQFIEKLPASNKKISLYEVRTFSFGFLI